MVEENNQKNIGVWETAAGSGKAGEMATGAGGTGESVSGVGELLKQATLEEEKEEPLPDDHEQQETAEEHAETARIKAEIDEKRQAITSKLNREVQLTVEEKAIVAAVHGVFEMYDLDKDGKLKEEELRPFFINFN